MKQYDVWGQIVEPLNIFDYNPITRPLLLENIVARTLWNAKCHGLIYKKYSRFRLNGGLYMMSWENFCVALPLFVANMRQIPVKKIKLSEILLTNCILNIVSFDKDLIIKLRIPLLGKLIFKYEDFKKNIFLKFLYFFGPGIPLSIIKCPINCLSGREIARHYMSGQKDLMIRDANKILDNYLK